jgi:hypothetical protein
MFRLTLAAVLASLFSFAAVAAELPTIRGIPVESVTVYSYLLPTTAAINDFSKAIPSCANMSFYWEQGDSAQVSVYNADSNDDTVGEIEANTPALAVLSTTTKSGPYTPTKAYVRFVVDTVNGTTPSRLRVVCDASLAAGGGVLGEGPRATMTATTATPGDLWLMDDAATNSCGVGGGANDVLCMYTDAGSWANAGAAVSGLANPLGADLSTAGFNIISGTNEDIDLVPNGSGNVDIDGADLDMSAAADFSSGNIINLGQIGSRIYYASTEGEIEAALTACSAAGIGSSDTPKGCTIYLESGIISTSDGITVSGNVAGTDGKMAIRIIGPGGSGEINGSHLGEAGTTIRWSGGGAGSVFSVGTCFRCEFAGFDVDGSGLANGFEFTNNAGGPAKVDMHHMGIFDTTTAVLGNTSGQFDESTFHHMSISSSNTAFHFRHSQNLGMVIGPATIITSMNGSGPFINLANGELTMSESYIGIVSDNDTAISFPSTATKLVLRDNVFEMPDYTGTVVVDADSSPTNGENHIFIMDGNRFVWNESGNVALDLAFRGTAWITNNFTSQSSGPSDLTPPTMLLDRDTGFAGNMTDVFYSNNKVQQSLTVVDEVPIPWVPTVGSGVRMSFPAFATDTEPDACLEGQLWVDTNAATGGQLHACDAGAWVTQGGTVTAVGECLSGACFDGLGDESYLLGATDFSFWLDADNGTDGEDYTGVFRIYQHDETEIFRVSEEAGASPVRTNSITQISGNLLMGTSTTGASDAGKLRFPAQAQIGWEAAPEGTDVLMGPDVNEAIQITGATGLDIGSGYIRGGVSVESTSGTPHSLTAAEGQWLFVTGAHEVDLPAVATSGQSACFFATTAAAITIDPNASEVIVLGGTAKTGGDPLVSTAAAGSFICLLSNGTYWYTLGANGSWS